METRMVVPSAEVAGGAEIFEADPLLEDRLPRHQPTTDRRGGTHTPCEAAGSSRPGFLGKPSQDEAAPDTG
jgi:hypothetical protein